MYINGFLTIDTRGRSSGSRTESVRGDQSRRRTPRRMSMPQVPERVGGQSLQLGFGPPTNRTDHINLFSPRDEGMFHT